MRKKQKLIQLVKERLLMEIGHRVFPGEPEFDRDNQEWRVPLLCDIDLRRSGKGQPVQVGIAISDARLSSIKLPSREEVVGKVEQAVPSSRRCHLEGLSRLRRIGEAITIRHAIAAAVVLLSFSGYQWYQNRQLERMVGTLTAKVVALQRVSARPPLPHLATMLEAQQIIADGSQEATWLLMLQARAQTSQVLAEVQRLQVIPAVAGGQTYLFLTSRQASPTSAVTLAEGLASTPALKTEYEAYMRQWGEVLRALGGVLFEARKIPEAIRVFEYLVNARPEPKTPQEKAELLGFMYALGELYKANQDHRAAVALYDQILTRELAPNDPRPAHYGGFSAYQRGDYDAALRYYDAALRIDPGYAKVWYNKALVFQAQGRETLYQEHLAQALALTRQAYDREGDKNPRVPFTLGILYATQGELDSALRYVEQALRRDHLYVVRAEVEPAFRVFQTRAPYDARFQALLDSYRPPQGKFGASSEAAYDPTIFNE